MKNKIKMLGIIAIVAIIGFSMTACGDSGGGDTFQGYPIRSGTPSSATLTKYGVTEEVLQTAFDKARAVNTSDADYKGWFEVTETNSGVTVSILGFIWLNKTEAKYNAMSAALELTGTDFGEYGAYINDLSMPADTVLVTGGTYGGTNIGVVEFFKKAYEDVPAGTLALVFANVTMK